MERQEVKKLIAVLTATYPNSFRDYNTAKLDNLISVWERVLKNVTYEQADAGLTVYLRSDVKGFPPSPGQVLNCIISVTEKSEDLVGEMEAWSMIMQALKNSGDIDRAREEFNALPGIVRATIGSPENLRDWALDEGFNAEVAQGIFLKQFFNMQQKIRAEKSMRAITTSPRLEATADMPAIETHDNNSQMIGGYGWNEERSRQIEALRKACFVNK